jgi:hypothetical protein
MPLPLGSVTVPCREVDEICEKAGLTVINTAIDQRAHFLIQFMLDSWPEPLGAEGTKKPHSGSPANNNVLLAN